MPVVLRSNPEGTLLSLCVYRLVSKPSKTPSTPIHNLDDDSLLNIFSFCRPIFFDNHEHGNIEWNWGHEHWWYKLVQVCRRWRYLIISSALHLRFYLLCTRGTPVADMLAHSPPFPLFINLNTEIYHPTTEDEERIMLALQHRDRVRRIRLQVPIQSLHNLITAIDGEFPVLEYLHIAPSSERDAHFTLPSTFEAPHLRHLWLDHFTSPMGSLSFTTAVGLVSVVLRWIYPSAYPGYPHPDDLLQPLSHLPRLETLQIGFTSPGSDGDIERQLSHRPVMTHVMLPRLRQFRFWGINAFLEALLSQMSAPLLETLSVHLFDPPNFVVPHLRNFMTTTEDLRFRSVKFLFSRSVVAMFAYPFVGATLPTFNIDNACPLLDRQVSSVAQIFSALSPIFSTVVELTLDYEAYVPLSSSWDNPTHRADWRKLLGSFRNVKTVRVHPNLVEVLASSLKSYGESPLEVLPRLEELVCPKGSRSNETVAIFIREREVAGQSVTLIERGLPVGHFDYEFLTSYGRTRTFASSYSYGWSPDPW